ncbi:undecaprenyl-diphosphatase [Sinobaca qinghaiensis]|uniref:Undecaprenyl-diphosphatase n=1 Tax=Sinobaca qinghaiensis TaxID=342944 RepID=A0A419V548_9BACL|nr:undecaprenyl-diphosphate phosphatase [Sinobaca qinghaiensis]RKD73571.1 undecaprenyl-diphosphatase [Sinobaca qinghaiensis]
MQDIWTLLKYLFLGLFQGITEPIPISSSGHLVIVQELIGLGNTGLEFLVLVNFGSLIAVLVVYWHDIVKLAANGITYVTTRKAAARDDFDFILYLVIATIPAGVIGLTLGDYIESELDKVWIVGATLIVTGFALWIIRNLRGSRNDGQLNWKDAVIIGLAQAVALIPGISRSGATIVAAMLLGTKQETALRFSFLLYIPISIGTTVLSLDTILGENLPDMWLNYLVAFIASIITSYISLKWFMNIMAKGNLKYFAIYCFIVGALVLLFIG